MARDKRKNVFIGFEEIGGNLTKIATEFKSQGFDCYCLLLGKYKFGTDVVLEQKKCIFSLYSFFFQKLTEQKSFFMKGLYAILSGFCSVLSLIYALVKYDNFIFDFNTSFFSKLPVVNKYCLLAYFDLRILHFFKKNVIMWYMGSDSRPPYISGRFKDENIVEIVRLTKKIYDRVQLVEKYCTYTIDNPAQAHFHKKKYVMFQAVGIPISERFIREKVRDEKVNSAIRIVHAPSAPEIKGTDQIRDIIERIRSIGYKIEYVEIIKKMHEEVMKELSVADIVIDEVYADSPLGGLGTEAAINRVPTVTSGYFASYAKEILGELMPPSCYCVPDNLEKELRDLIDNKEKRISLGKKAYEFVTENWSTEQVVQKFVQIINNDVPDDWYYDPYICEYPYGEGISKTDLKRVIKRLIKEVGLNGLYINDKPKLLNKYMQLCDEKNVI